MLKLVHNGSCVPLAGDTIDICGECLALSHSRARRGSNSDDCLLMRYRFPELKIRINFHIRKVEDYSTLR